MVTSVRRAVVLLALLTLAPMLSATTAARAAQPGVLRFSEGLDVATLNPFLAQSGNVADLSEFTMASLVSQDPAGRTVPVLATEVPSRANGGVSSDGLTLVYHLRRGVKWSDGVPFDADDVLFTVAVARDPHNDIVIASSESWSSIRSVGKRDAYTIVVKLRAPNIEVPRFWLAAGTQQCILPKHAFTGTAINTAPYNALPIGIGPFRYTAFRRGDAVEMEANPNWYGPKPKLQRVVYKIITNDNTSITELQTGELDLLIGINGTDADRVRTFSGKRVDLVPSTFMSGIFLNTARPPTNDVFVRRAMRLATDRKGAFERIVRGNGALTDSFVARVLPDTSLMPAVPFDPEAAGRLLDEHGWKLGADGTRSKNGVPLTVDVAYPNGYAVSARFVEEVRESWKRAGIVVASHVYATGLYFAPYADGGIIQGGKFGAALLSQAVGSYGGLRADIGCASVPPHGANATRYCNPQVDAAIAQYLRTESPGARKQLVARVERLLYDDVPIVVQYERSFVRAYDEHLNGLRSGAYVMFYEPWNLEL